MNVNITWGPHGGGASALLGLFQGKQEAEPRAGSENREGLTSPQWKELSDGTAPLGPPWGRGGGYPPREETHVGKTPT